MRKLVLKGRGTIRVQTWDDSARAPSAVEDLLRVAWPKETGAVASGRGDVMCIGPMDWLVVAPDPADHSWLERFDAAFLGSPFRATNISDALARIGIEGPETRDLLAKACLLDLHPPLFPVGRSARTRFAGMPVIVCCTGTSKFELVVTRGYADFLWSWLGDAELEFEPPA